VKEPSETQLMVYISQDGGQAK